MAAAAQKIEWHQMGAHAGNLLKMTAQRYPSLGKAILEQVQNALDANARNVYVHIDFLRLVVMVRDDGNGVNTEDLAAALMSIGKSDKERKKDKIGRFGIGFISPLDKCERFSLTSVKRGGGTYHEWTFNCHDILKSPEFQRIPCKPCPELIYSRDTGRDAPRGKKYVPWRTQVRIEKFSTRDATLSRIVLSDFGASILGEYGAKMRQLDATVHVKLINANSKEETGEFQAEDFEGEKLEQWEKTVGAAGRVRVSLWRAPVTKGKSSGTVHLGELDNLHRLEPQDSKRSIREIMGDDTDTASALVSGLFNGEILAENVELKPERNAFERNDASRDLKRALNLWFEEIGWEWVEESKQEQAADRWQRTGEAAMDLLRRLMGNNAALQRAIEDLKLLTSPRAGSSEVPVTVETPDRNPGTGSGGGQHSHHPEKPRPQVSPPPSGKKRPVVRSLFGIQVTYSQMSGKDCVAVFDATQAIVDMNVRHSLWKLCESIAGDSVLVEYQQHVITMMLLVHAEDINNREMMERLLTTYLQVHIEGMITKRHKTMETARAGKKSVAGRIKRGRPKSK